MGEGSANTIFDEAYYYSLKAESRSRVVNSLNNKIKQTGTYRLWNELTICSIDDAAIDFSRRVWPRHYGEVFAGLPHSWEKLFHKFSNRPSFFDVAIWRGRGEERVLQGMAIGQPSNRHTRMAIHYLERSYTPDYLPAGVLVPILSCAEEYAKLLGSRYVVLRGAGVDPGPFDKYGYRDLQLSGLRGSLAKEVCYGRDC